MKNIIRCVVSLALTFVIVSVLSVGVFASPFEWSMEVGDDLTLSLSDTPYESSDTSVIEIRHEGGVRYTAVAVGKGTATVTGGTWMGHEQQTYEFVVYNSMFDRVLGTMGVFFIIALVLVLLVIAEIIYIFVTAPKCGMTRAWALVPLFSNFIGLIVFIVVRSNRKATNPHAGRSITCPTCGSVHSAGTAECYVCGTKLK